MIGVWKWGERFRTSGPLFSILQLTGYRRFLFRRITIANDLITGLHAVIVGNNGEVPGRLNCLRTIDGTRACRYGSTRLYVRPFTNFRKCLLVVNGRNVRIFCGDEGRLRRNVVGINVRFLWFPLCRFEELSILMRFLRVSNDNGLSRQPTMVIRLFRVSQTLIRVATSVLLLRVKIFNGTIINLLRLYVKGIGLVVRLLRPFINIGRFPTNNDRFLRLLMCVGCNGWRGG